MRTASRHWRLWIDTGGTFTDCLGVDPDGGVHRAKILSSAALRGHMTVSEGGARLTVSQGDRTLPDGFFNGCTVRTLDGTEKHATVVASFADGHVELDRMWPAGRERIELEFREEAPVLGARVVTATLAGEPLPVSEVRFATTRGTNALLERRGEAVALFVTHGFADLLEIGTQQRPDLFALQVEKPPPLHARVIQVEERMAADGSVERPLDLQQVAEKARECLDAGVDVAAVALLHSYRNPTHEQDLRELLEEIGFSHISVSSELGQRIKIVPRAETAVVDAYLSKTVGQYLAKVSHALQASSLHVMTSAGGLVRDTSYRAKDSLLSGPAGGVVGAIAAGAESGIERLLAFDMGGTSTDVTRYDGEPEYRSETVVGGVCLTSPSLAVETVAAGGGSICRMEGRQLRVGPESAGADPGPACYGKDGPLTLTDVNLLLGRLLVERFPFQVDVGAAERRARELSAAHEAELGEGLGTAALLFGLLRIANEKMASAVRAISLQAGYRPSDYALLTFGGAGPQHACALADLLGVKTVLVPADAALLSARGLGHARLERIAEQQVLQPLSRMGDEVAAAFESLAARAADLLVEEGVEMEQVSTLRREVFIRCAGQESTLGIDCFPGGDLAAAFHSAYEAHFGYRPEGSELEVESLRLIAAAGAPVESYRSAVRKEKSEARIERRSFFSTVGWIEADVFERGDLGLQDLMLGPALVVEEHTLTVVEPGWKAQIDLNGALVLERV